MFVDCNAVNVETVHRIASIIGSTGAQFVDGEIIGPPPGPQGEPPYISRPGAPALGALGDLGLKVRIMKGPVGAASALKMSYAGINKGGILLLLRCFWAPHAPASPTPCAPNWSKTSRNS